ncbi:MAG: hypothetical protein KFW21_05680 [Spirochaetota bacterium]|nr:hypothetical protein [Spirochaetota bacterium]
MENMKSEKYNLEELLLYLENKLSANDSQKISHELLNNKNQLNYLIELAKIKNYTETVKNKILFSCVEDTWTVLCTGLVELLEEKKLIFRGQEQSTCYRYNFLDLIITIVQDQNNYWALHIDNHNHVGSYTVIDDKGLLIATNNNIQNIQISIPGNYYLLFRNELITKVLEIK